MKIYLKEQFHKSIWNLDPEDFDGINPIAEIEKPRIGELLEIQGGYYNPCLINGEKGYCIVEESDYSPEEEFDTGETRNPICPYCGHKLEYEGIGNTYQGKMRCSNCNGEVEYLLDFNPIWTTYKHLPPKVRNIS